MQIKYKDGKVSKIIDGKKEIECQIPKDIIPILKLNAKVYLTQVDDNDYLKLYTDTGTTFFIVTNDELKYKMQESKDYLYKYIININDEGMSYLKNRISDQKTIIIDLKDDHALMDAIFAKKLFKEHPDKYQDMLFKAIQVSNKPSGFKTSTPPPRNSFQLYQKQKKPNDIGMIHESFVVDTLMVESMYRLLQNSSSMHEFKQKVQEDPSLKSIDIDNIDYKYTSKGIELKIYDSTEKMKCVSELNFDKVNNVLSCTNEYGQTSRMESRDGEVIISVPQQENHSILKSSSDITYSDRWSSQNDNSSNRYSNRNDNDSTDRYHSQDSRKYESPSREEYTTPRYENTSYSHHSPSPSYDSSSSSPSYDSSSSSPSPSFDP